MIRSKENRSCSKYDDCLTQAANYGRVTRRLNMNGRTEEVLIRSLIEGLSIQLIKDYQDKPRHKHKLHLAQDLYNAIDQFWAAYPIYFTWKEQDVVTKKLLKLHEIELSHPDHTKETVIISLLMALIDNMARKVSRKNGKMKYVDRINDLMTALYDSFDRKCNKIEHMELGAKIAEGII